MSSSLASARAAVLASFFVWGWTAWAWPSAASAQAGDPAAAADPGANAAPSPQDVAAEDAAGQDLFDFLESEVEVVTVELASKRAQSVFDAPADVTVVNREYIESTQVENVAELLKRVPGVQVVNATGGSYNVGLRGINRLGNNYTLVMIDGLKASSFTLGYVPWAVLAVDAGDLERIEVLHGPGSTLYGADAVSGVINMVTKRPLDHSGSEGRVAAGNYIVPNIDPVGGEYPQLFNSGGGYAAHNFANEGRTLGLRLSGGFRATPDWDGNPEIVVPQNGQFHYHVALTGQYQRNDLSVLLSASHGLAERELSFTAAADSLSYRTSRQDVSATVEQGNLVGGIGSVKGRVAARLEDTAARTFREERGTIFNLEPSVLSLFASVQSDWSLFGGRNNLTVGIDAEHDEIEGFQGDLNPAADYIAAVAQNELVILEKPRLLLSAGARAEVVTFSEDTSNVDVTYRNFNPRGALVLNLDDRHSIRAVSATAFRTPSAFEVFNRAVIDNGDPDLPNTSTILPNPSLRPSRSLTFELGYRGRILEPLTVNVTGFFQRVNDFIDISRSLNFPVRYENLFDVNHFGGSGELTYTNPKLGTFWGHYTYLRSEEANGGPRIEDWPAHLGGVGARIPLRGGFQISGQFSYWSSIAPEVISVVGRSGLAPIDDTVAAQAMLDFRASRSLFEGRGQLFLAINNALGAVRDRDDLRQYVSDTVEPIGASVMLGIQFREKTDEKKQ